jgi:DNA-binding NarL/FixJ family response regulator
MPTVVAGKFEDLVSVGLNVLISEDPSLDLVARDVPMPEVDAVVAKHEPSVVLLNFGTLPTPVEVQRLHEAHPGTRIVVLANKPTSGDCDQLLSFGASACLSKDTEARDIINAIHLACRGMHVLPRSAAAGGGLERLGSQGAELTPREAEVLALLQDDWSNSQIGEQLSIGIETVRTHARSIYRKLGVSSRRDLARLARRDLVVVDDQRRPLGGTEPGRFDRASGGARDAEKPAHVE